MGEMHRASTTPRFVAALVLALAAHAVLFAGIDLPSFTPPGTPRSLTITLAGYQQATTPAATVDAVVVPSTPVAPVPAPEPPPRAIAAEPPRPVPALIGRPLAGKTVVDLARDIAALDRTSTARANPTQRVRRLLAGTTTTPEFAYYLEAWRRKVERIGNLNYPREARSRGLNGSLRLLVTITAEGALRDVRVLETSGHRTLDEAALHIVRLAAPYAPFSPKMRATTDLLEIERTWHFRNSRYSS